MPELRLHDLDKLPRSFYDRDTQEVANTRLGKVLVRMDNGRALAGMITEVEAYLGPHALAAHTSKGLPPRTRVMFGPPGHAYVYLIYGIHHCMNVVTEADGTGAAVLLRGLQPLLNINDNTRGPGRLCKAMGIDRRLYGHDLCSDDFFIARVNEDALWQSLFDTGQTVNPSAGAALPGSMDIVSRPRIGVDYAGEWAGKPLRFYIGGNAWISRP